MTGEKQWYHRYEKALDKCRLPVGSAFLTYSGAVLYSAAVYPAWFTPRWWGVHLVAITVLPPLWFFVEFNVLSGRSVLERERLKGGQEVASKLWAAVLAGLLYFFPGGPLETIARLLGEIARKASAVN